MVSVERIKDYTETNREVSVVFALYNFFLTFRGVCAINKKNWGRGLQKLGEFEFHIHFPVIRYGVLVKYSVLLLSVAYLLHTVQFIFCGELTMLPRSPGRLGI